jgi:hypothetical protein
MTCVVWIFQRATLVPGGIPSGLDPIMGKRDPVAIHDTYGPYIPMPSDRKTREEMVAWMITELPKLTTDSTRNEW